MRRLDASLGTRLEKLLNPGVPEALDYMLSVTHRDTQPQSNDDHKRNAPVI